VPPILPPQNGFLFLDKAKFAARSRRMSMRRSRSSWPNRRCRGGLTALNGEVTEASWRTKPSWYLVATDDHMIPRTRSVSCPSGPVRRCKSRRAVTPFMCRSRSGCRAHRAGREGARNGVTLDSNTIPISCCVAAGVPVSVRWRRHITNPIDRRARMDGARRSWFAFVCRNVCRSMAANNCQYGPLAHARNR